MGSSEVSWTIIQMFPSYILTDAWRILGETCTATRISTETSPASAIRTRSAASTNKGIGAFAECCLWAERKASSHGYGMPYFIDRAGTTN